MTERELRAKLALYESSEVTVEKMLKYQSKIEELRTSQVNTFGRISFYFQLLNTARDVT